MIIVKSVSGLVKVNSNKKNLNGIRCGSKTTDDLGRNKKCNHIHNKSCGNGVKCHTHIYTTSGGNINAG